MKLKEIVFQRLVKSIYMGFVMSNKANDYLGKRYSLSKEDFLKFIDAFNKNTDLEFNHAAASFNENNNCRIRAIGKTTFVTAGEITHLFKEIETLINSNLQRAASSTDDIEIYDLNTLDMLDRSTYNTMGDKYFASNGKRYMVNFMHLYSVGDYY